MNENAKSIQIRRLFRPTSIAIVGASTSFEKAGSQLVHALREFKGDVYPINPTAAEIQGLKAYPNLASLPRSPDLVAMAVPASVTPAVMREAAAARAGGALIIGGGFAEIGEQGATLQARMLTEARAGGVRLLGPNTSGFFDPARGCYATFAPGTETIGAGSVVPRQPVPHRSPPGHPATVGHDDDEALVGEPLRGQMGTGGVDDALTVGSAVGVHQHGEPA